MSTAFRSRPLREYSTTAGPGRAASGSSSVVPPNFGRSFLLMWMDVLLMGVFRTNDEVGVYGACARIAPAIVMVNMSVGPVFLTRMSRLFVSRDWKAADRLYKLAGSWSLWAGTLIAALLFVWGPNFLALFGTEFTSGAPVL